MPVHEPMSVEAALKSLQFTSGWPQRVSRELASLGSLLSVSAGEVLFHEGGSNGRVSLGASGRIGIEMLLPGRGRLRVLSLGPGDVVAWSAVLDSGKMTATGVAEEPSLLLVMSGAHLRQLCARDHEVGYFVMQRLAEAVSRRLVATSLQLLDIFGCDEPAP